MKMMFYRREYKKTQTPVKRAAFAPPFQKGALAALLLILCLVIMSSCTFISVQEDMFFTMDTIAETTIITRKSETGKEANERIREICEEIEGRISHTVQSEIMTLNAILMRSDNALLSYELSKETAGLLETAKYMKEQTGGAFNPNLGALIDMWGLNSKHSYINEEHKLPERDAFYPALEKIQNSDYEIIQAEDNFYINSDILSAFDLGAIGKGYAIDEISDYLVDAGIPNALVSFGSSILAAGKNKSGELWTIGLKDPLNPDDKNKISGYINATDKVISVSGGYERFITINGRDYCHIIDPETGYPVDNDLLCVVVVMSSQSALQTKSQREKFINNGAISDALSTALYVMGKEKALNFYNNSHLDFEMILFVKDNSPRGYDIIPTNVIFTEMK